MYSSPKRNKSENLYTTVPKISYIHCSTVINTYPKRSIKPPWVRTAASKLMNQLISQRVHYYCVGLQLIRSDQLSPVAAMQFGAYLVLKSLWKLPSLDHTQTLLFPQSITHTRPSEPNVTSPGQLKHPGPLLFDPKANRNILSSSWTVTQWLPLSQM